MSKTRCEKKWIPESWFFEYFFNFVKQPNEKLLKLKLSIMKKFCMIALALVMTTGAFAQKMWLGGTAAVSASGTATLNINPTFGYFITEDISVEGELGLSFGSNRANYGLTVVGRYWLPISEKLSYTPGLSLGFGVAHDSYWDTTTSNFNIAIKLGSFHYKLNDKWMLGANFSSFTLNDLGGGNYTYFSLGTSTTISVNYFF